MRELVPVLDGQFRYAFNAGILDLAILDTVGHGLNSAVLAALLVGAYRHSRRAGVLHDAIKTGASKAIHTKKRELH